MINTLPRLRMFLAPMLASLVKTRLKGTVSRFYHDFERFKNTPRSCITQQKWFYFGKHHSTNDNNPLGSEDG